MASERATRLTDSFNEIDPALGDEVYWQTVEATAEKFLQEERREAAQICSRLARYEGSELVADFIAETFGLEETS